jgi:hypothetical protein
VSHLNYPLLSNTHPLPFAINTLNRAPSNSNNASPQLFVTAALYTSFGSYPFTTIPLGVIAPEVYIIRRESGSGCARVDLVGKSEGPCTLLLFQPRFQGGIGSIT